MVGRLRAELIDPNDWEKMTAARQVAINAHEAKFSAIKRIRHVDGHYIPVETIGTILYDENTHYAGCVFLTRDITEPQRQQELFIEKDRLEASLDKERELNTLKSRMMERIVHEFRTPLTIIQLTSETLAHYTERLTQDQRFHKAKVTQDQI